MGSNYFVEVNCQQINHYDERCCGDVFLTKRVKEENRMVMVLSDGMGHGIKANLLATLTATMAVNFSVEHKEPEKTAEIIMNTLPVCSERKMSYSTFTIVDVDTEGDISMIGYDNPPAMIWRGTRLFDPGWTGMVMQSEKNYGKELISCVYTPQKEDRIVICTDGITQSGLDSGKYNFGWGIENLQDFIRSLIEEDPDISARKLAMRVANKAHINDNYQSKDDSSCAVIYFREPRKLMLCSGPPFEKEKDALLAETLKNFKGKKIICGATTVDIIARELNLEVEDSFEFTDPDLPPVSYMQGVDLVTEGILTLGKVNEILNNYNTNYVITKGPADQIVKLLLMSDQITFITGTAINIAHQDPNIPVDLEIRRTVIRRIGRVLEEKFLKEVKLEYL